MSKASREGTRERVSGGCTCVSFRVFVCNSYVTSGEKSSLARSFPSRFSRTNRRACSQASLQANLNGALNQALGMGQTSQKQFSDKHSVVSFNFSGLWTLLCPLRPPTGMCSACYCIKRINDMSFDLQFLSRWLVTSKNTCNFSRRKAIKNITCRKKFQLTITPWAPRSPCGPRSPYNKRNIIRTYCSFQCKY